MSRPEDHEHKTDSENPTTRQDYRLGECVEDSGSGRPRDNWAAAGRA